MKPSERRALEAEKRAQKEAEARERELEKQAKKGGGESDKTSTPVRAPDNERIDVSAPYEKPEEEEIEVQGDGYHRESFFGSHVRLITFIISLTLVLTVLGPWGIDQLVSRKRNDYAGEDVLDKRNMTVEELIEIADKGMNMRWSDLKDFNYKDCSYNYKDKGTGKSGTYYIREYSISDDLVLKVHGYSVSGSPGYAQLILLRDDGSKLMEDIRTSSVRSFLSRNNYKY